MTVIALASAKASPGVTTTALALASAWPARQLLVAECDVAGGTIMGGYFRGTVAPTGGLAAAAVAARHELTVPALYEVTVPLSEDGAVRLLPGLSDPAQARVVQQAGPRLAAAFSALGRLSEPVDVLVDCGRLGAVGFPSEVLLRADLIVFVTRPREAELLLLAKRVEGLRAALRDVGGLAPELGVLMVGEGGHSRADVARHLGLPVWDVIAEDQRTAAFFAGEADVPRGGLARSGLQRSAYAAANSLVAVAASRQQAIAGLDRSTSPAEGGGPAGTAPAPAPVLPAAAASDSRGLGGSTPAPEVLRAERRTWPARGETGAA